MTQYIRDEIKRLIAAFPQRPVLAETQAVYVDALGDMDPAALHQAVRDDEAALEALSVAHFSKKLIGEAEYYAARQDILDRLTPNRARLDSQPQAVVAPGIIGATVDELASLWERAPTPIRRTLLTTIIDTVTVLPAGKGRRFAPEQIRLTWRY